MSAIGTALVEVQPDTRNFGRDVESGIGGAFRRVAGIAAAAFAGVQVAGIFKDAIAEAQEARKIAAQTEAGIKSTGGAAHVTAKQVDELASALSRKTAIDDEAIAGAENMLLTFTNIRNEVGKGNDIFNQATGAVADLATKMNGGMTPSAEQLQGASVQLGKALNDPIRGITALSRVGVNFTEQQRAQIKTLVESGKTMEAQKIILAELTGEFGGAAAAAATPLDHLKVTIGNLKETIGTALLPIVDKVATALSGALPKAIEFVQEAWQNLTAGFKGGGFLDAATKGFGVFVGLGETARSVFEGLKPVIGAVIQTLSVLFKGDFVGGGPFAEDSPFVATLFKVRDFIADNLKPILIGLGAVILALTSPVTAVVGALVFLYTHFQSVREAVATVVAIFREKVMPVLGDVTGLIVDKVIGAFNALKRAFEDNRPQIEAVLAAFGAVVSFVVGEVLPILARLVGFMAGQMIDNIKRTVETIFSVVGAVVRVTQGIAGFFGELSVVVPQKIGEIIAFFKSIPSRILEALGNVGKLLFNVGRDIVQGLIDGIKSFAKSIGRAIVDLVPGPIKFAVEKALGIGSPSKVFAEYGRNIVEGLIVGVQGSMPDLSPVMQQLAQRVEIPGLRDYLSTLFLTDSNGAPDLDWANDFLTHIPSQFRDQARALGKEISESLLVAGNRVGLRGSVPWAQTDAWFDSDTGTTWWDGARAFLIDLQSRPTIGSVTINEAVDAEATAAAVEARMGMAATR